MHNHSGTLATGSMVATLLLAAGSAGAAERLVVRTYDTVGLASSETTIARDAVNAILSDAGLRLVWRDCEASCDAPGSREVVVRIVTAPKTAASGTLGFAVVDVEQGTGMLATVYADRVKSMARRTGANAGRLMGRAMAHEIGHLLLGTSHHSVAGLMRARWSDGELQRDLGPDWALSRQDIDRIGRVLIALAQGAVRF
jgi:hypothetical protein